MLFDRVVWLRLIIKEYGSKIFYIPGPNNVVTDVLSRLPTMDVVLNQKKYACTKYIDDESLLDACKIVQAQPTKLSLPTSDFKRKIYKDKLFYVQYMTYTN